MDKGTHRVEMVVIHVIVSMVPVRIVVICVMMSTVDASEESFDNDFNDEVDDRNTTEKSSPMVWATDEGFCGKWFLFFSKTMSNSREFTA